MYLPAPKLGRVSLVLLVVLVSRQTVLVTCGIEAAPGYLRSWSLVHQELEQYKELVTNALDLPGLFVKTHSDNPPCRAHAEFSELLQCAQVNGT